MSSWTTLNVAYDGDWEMPELFLSRVWIGEHPNEGFDILMYVFQRGEDLGEVKSFFQETAEEYGDTECLVTVSGSDTSDVFTFELVEDGCVQDSWSNTASSGFDVSYESDGDILDRIEDDLGRRPSFGGNYT